jgi:hypothetical protein
MGGIIPPRGYGGTRRTAEHVKKDAWINEGYFVVSESDQRLSWEEREMVTQIGKRIYGARVAKQ